MDKTIEIESILCAFFHFYIFHRLLMINDNIIRFDVKNLLIEWFCMNHYEEISVRNRLEEYFKRQQYE